MKYIHFEHLGLVIFEETITHIEMKQPIRDKPLSAGFITSESPRSFGKSSTLDLPSRPEDAERFKGRCF